MRRILLIITSALVILHFGCSPSKEFVRKEGKEIAGKDALIKVLILKTGDFVKFGSDGQIKISYLKTGEVIYKGESKEYTFYAEKVSNPIVVESWASPLKCNGKPYRGIFELHNIVGKLNVVNVLTMDEYLCGVVPSEMSPNWPIEALKAQAVAARTYAYYHIKQTDNVIFNLDSSTKFQVYNGMSAESELANQAVKETSGVIITHNNQPILALFHSTSGGKIISSKYVWNGNELPYLIDKNIPYGQSSPHYNWETEISLYEMKKLLSNKYSNVGTIKGVSFKKHNERAISVVITHSNGMLKMTGNDFR